MTSIDQAQAALITRVLDGDGRASPSQRRAAYDNASLAEPVGTLIDKVSNYAYRVSDDDIVAVRASGLSDDEIFELVVCAAIGEASRQYNAAVAALESANRET